MKKVTLTPHDKLAMEWFLVNDDSINCPWDRTETKDFKHSHRDCKEICEQLFPMIVSAVQCPCHVYAIKTVRRYANKALKGEYS